MPETMLDNILSRTEEISKQGVQLLTEFSGMHPINKPGDSVVLISPSGNNWWNPLPPEGKQIQLQLLAKISRFSELVLSLSRKLPSTAQKQIISGLEKIRRDVQQEDKTWWGTKDEAASGFQKAIKEVTTVLTDFFYKSASTVLVVPDTNALLRNPDLESWSFNVSHFVIVLTPTILSELDHHKVNHRNPDVREKAEKLINKIKEYRRRGSLSEGVNVVSGRISLQSIANEPNMQQTLSWFDQTNADDRFLASTLEIMADHLGDTVFIVTADINMLNKAEMAGIPFREVP